MNARPAVSIAIRGRRRDTIEGAIASVLAQTWTDLELIVYDDAGDLDEICAQFDDSRLRYVRAERKCGASGRWLAAVAHCSDDCIGLLDDDDRYAPQFIERMLTALQLHPQAGIAFCREAAGVESGSISIESDVERRVLTQRWSAATSTMLMRRAALDAAQRLQPMPDGVSPDLYVNFHVAATGWQHLCVEGALCIRSRHGARISNSLTGARYALATFEQLRCGDLELERLRRIEVARRHIVLAGYLVMDGRRSEALAELRAAHACAPSAHRGLRWTTGALAHAPLGRHAARFAWVARGGV